jgi:hypothetical protein
VRDTKTTKQAKSIEDYLLGMTGYALGYRHETGLKETDVVIDSLVRTKVPKYVPLYGGQISDQRISSFASVLESASGGINAGSFIPNGLSNGACRWCGYADRCTYRKR